MIKDNTLIMNISGGEAEISIHANNVNSEFITFPVSGLHKGDITDNDSFIESFQNSKFLRIINSYDFNEILIGISPSKLITKTEKSTIFDSNSVKAINEEDMVSNTEDSSVYEPNLTLIHKYSLGYFLDGKDSVLNPLGMHARKFEIYMLKVFIESNISKSLLNLIEKIGASCSVSIISNTLAKSLYFADDENKDNGCYFINIGKDVTELSVIHKNKILYMDAIPVGEQNFINDIALTLNINEKDSKILVDKFGTITPELIRDKESINITTKTGQEEKISNKRVGAIMRERANELLNISKKSFEDSSTNNLSINRLVISGPGTKYEGFESLSKYIFQFFIYMPNKILNISEPIECLASFQQNYKNLKLIIPEISTKKILGIEINKNKIYMKNKLKKLFNLNVIIGG